MTVEEWHAHWRDEGLGARAPEVTGLAAVFLEVREARAVVVVFETPVLEYQRPVVEVAEQYGVDVRLLEDEVFGREGAVPVHDENHRRCFSAEVRDVGVPSPVIYRHICNPDRPLPSKPGEVRWSHSPLTVTAVFRLTGRS